MLAAIAVRDLAGADGRVAVRVGVDTGVVVIEGGRRRAGELSGIAGEPLRAATRLRAARRGRPGARSARRRRTPSATSSSSHRPIAAGDALAGARARIRGRRPRAPSPAGSSAATRRSPSWPRSPSGRRRGSCPVVVSGPAGIGKSAVVEHLPRRPRRSEVRGRLFCDRRHSATPLHPLRPVLPELFDDRRRAVGPRRPRRAAASAGATANPVLVVDDVDAADPSTLDLLDALPDHLASGLVVLTSRSPAPVELGGEVVARIALGPLDRAASRQVAAATVAGARRLRLDTLNEIADRSGGVPLHVQALTRAVLDARTARRAPCRRRCTTR